MNFFKSVFSDPDTDPNEEIATATADETVGAWSFGGLIKTISAKSESVIQTYRRDIEEFSSELKKETAGIREAAARVVLDLPLSLESGASIAQESLETVGQAIDDFGNSVWRGATEIISLSEDALLFIDSDGAAPSPSGSNPSGASSKKYSRYEARLLAIQSDPGTFREEPEDCEEFNKWKEGFLVEEKDEEIQVLLHESNPVEGYLDKMVPFAVDYETFWSRYFYRVHKLKQAEDATSNLANRVISGEDDEDLSWEVEEDDDEVHAQNELVEALKVENLESDFSRSDSCKDSDFSVVSSQPSMPGEEDELEWDELEDLGEHQDEKWNGSSGSSNRVDLRERVIVGEEDEDLNWDIEDDVDTAKA